MLVLLSVYYLSRGSFAQAIPISSIAEREPSSCNDLHHCRTIWDIIWSCLVTIFLSTWVAAHPNIPYPVNDHGRGRLVRWLWYPLRTFISHRLPLFVCTLLVPEYVLAFAIRQRIVASRIAKRNKGWTITHGFFVIMGGFHLFRSPDRPRKPLNPHEDDVPQYPLSVDDLIRNGKFKLDFVAPTEEEIKDKSTSDWLAKTLVLVQTTWFTMQCIARGVKHLPVTELEIVTLAYAMMSFWMYLFWWNKPLNVKRPVRVFGRAAAHRRDGGSRGGVARTRVRRYANRWNEWFSDMLSVILGFQDDGVQLSSLDKVPIFWSGKPESSDQILADAVTLVVAIMFGGIHCIAWSFAFPTRMERILWRISCVSIVAAPLCISALFLLPSFGDPRETHLIVLSPLVPLSLLYIAGRIVTVSVAFASLRSLIPGAYETVRWTTFIPHI